jgi:hypothetical protein
MTKNVNAEDFEMKITRLSPFSGKTHTQEIPVTQYELDEWKTGNRNIQDVMPLLDPDQREFLMTGITKEEWEKEFAQEELDSDIENYGDEDE